MFKNERFVKFELDNNETKPLAGSDKSISRTGCGYKKFQIQLSIISISLSLPYAKKEPPLSFPVMHAFPRLLAIYAETQTLFFLVGR